MGKQKQQGSPEDWVKQRMSGVIYIEDRDNLKLKDFVEAFLGYSTGSISAWRLGTTACHQRVIIHVARHFRFRSLADVYKAIPDFSLEPVSEEELKRQWVAFYGSHEPDNLSDSEVVKLQKDIGQYQLRLADALKEVENLEVKINKMNQMAKEALPEAEREAKEVVELKAKVVFLEGEKASLLEVDKVVRRRNAELKKRNQQLHEAYEFLLRVSCVAHKEQHTLLQKASDWFEAYKKEEEHEAPSPKV